MRIEQHISQLLYRYQCVTVPGFGAFLTEFVSAQLHEPSHTFSPPKKVVSFNIHLKNNDGLLANHIAQVEQITYETAVRFIELMVSDWKSLLSNNEVLYLNNIGHVRLNSEGGLVFKPFENTNYNMGSFGLSEVVCNEVERFVSNNQEFLNETTVENIEEVQEDVNVVSISNDQRQPKSWIRYAAAAVVTLGVLSAASYYWLEEKVAQETLIVEQKVQEKVNQKIQEATFFIDTPLPAITINIAENKKPYHIVSGAFREKQNAEKALQQLISQGFKANIGEINAYGLYPVFYGSYAKSSEALEAMQFIKRNHNPEAWLLVKE